MTPNKESDDVLLKHIQECIARIREYTADGRTAFYESTLVQDAVMRNLQNLAESTQRLSETIKNSEPHVPWRDIAGFRNVLTHDYFGINLDTVWSVVEADLPHLALAIDRMALALHGAQS